MALGAVSKAEAVEAELRLFPGVIAARCLWPETATAPELVRLLAEAQRGGRELLDATRTLLTVRFGTDLPEDRIVLLPVAISPDRSRFRLDGFEVVTGAREQRLRLQLTMPVLDQQVGVERLAMPLPNGMLRAAAEAVVEAINEYVGHTFDLEAVGPAQLGKETLMLSALRSRTRGGEEPMLVTLHGVSTNTGDPMEAAIRATLDAANRIFR